MFVVFTFMSPTTDSPWLMQQLCSGSWALCTLELSAHTVNYVCLYKGVQLKWKLQHTGTWSTTAWLPCLHVTGQQYSSVTLV